MSSTGMGRPKMGRCAGKPCDPKTGKCVNPPVAAGTTCTDNNACTSNNGCQDGKCTGTAAVFSDNNPCTNDQWQPITGPCTCNAINGCGPGCKLAADCDDKNPCTFEVCNAFNGTCIYQNLPNCNPTPKCTANADCNDNNVCTSDICNPSNSTCLNAPIAGCNPNQQCKVEADCDDKNIGTWSEGPQFGLAGARRPGGAQHIARRRIVMADDKVCRFNCGMVEKRWRNSCRGKSRPAIAFPIDAQRAKPQTRPPKSESPCPNQSRSH